MPALSGKAERWMTLWCHAAECSVFCVHQEPEPCSLPQAQPGGLLRPCLQAAIMADMKDTHLLLRTQTRGCLLCNSSFLQAALAVEVKELVSLLCSLGCLLPKISWIYCTSSLQAAMAADMKDAQSLLRFWALKAEKQAANPDMDPGRRIQRQSSDVAADQPESMAQVG